MTCLLIFGVLSIVAVVAIVTLMWAVLVIASRSDEWDDALQQAIYGEGDDGNN